MREFLANLNDRLRQIGAPIINEAGADFIENVIKNKKNGYEDDMFAGIYLNSKECEPKKTDRVWLVKDDSPFAITLHISDCIICVYVEKDNREVFDDQCNI